MHVCLSHQNSKIQVLATVTVMKNTVTPVQLLLVCFHTWNVCGVDVVKFVVLVFLVYSNVSGFPSLFPWCWGYSCQY